MKKCLFIATAFAALVCCATMVFSPQFFGLVANGLSNVYHIFRDGYPLDVELVVVAGVVAVVAATGLVFLSLALGKGIKSIKRQGKAKKSAVAFLITGTALYLVLAGMFSVNGFVGAFLNLLATGTITLGTVFSKLKMTADMVVNLLQLCVGVGLFIVALFAVKGNKKEEPKPVAVKKTTRK